MGRTAFGRLAALLDGAFKDDFGSTRATAYYRALRPWAEIDVEDAILSFIDDGSAFSPSAAEVRSRIKPSVAEDEVPAWEDVRTVLLDTFKAYDEDERREGLRHLRHVHPLLEHFMRSGDATQLRWLMGKPPPVFARQYGPGELDKSLLSQIDQWKALWDQVVAAAIERRVRLEARRQIEDQTEAR